jgi:hypothetical protein
VVWVRVVKVEVFSAFVGVRRTSVVVVVVHRWAPSFDGGGGGWKGLALAFVDVRTFARGGWWWRDKGVDVRRRSPVRWWRPFPFPTPFPHAPSRSPPSEPPLPVGLAFGLELVTSKLVDVPSMSIPTYLGIDATSSLTTAPAVVVRRERGDVVQDVTIAVVMAR